MSKKERIRLTFFGDSICVGQGVSLYHGWVSRIAKDLDDFVVGRDFDVIVANASVNGRTTRQALEDMPYQIQSPGVDVLLVQFGLNDCNYWKTDLGVPRVSLEGFKANLKEIINRGFCAGAKRIFLNNNHPTTRNAFWDHSNITYEESNRIYSDAVRDIAGGFGSDVIFTDVSAAFRCAISFGECLENFLLDDGLHLSAKGHQFYYDLMFPKIVKAVSELGSHD